jgi:hypothetical protein
LRGNASITINKQPCDNSNGDYGLGGRLVLALLQVDKGEVVMQATINNPTINTPVLWVWWLFHY